MHCHYRLSIVCCYLLFAILGFSFSRPKQIPVERRKNSEEVESAQQNGPPKQVNIYQKKSPATTASEDQSHNTRSEKKERKSRESVAYSKLHSCTIIISTNHRKVQVFQPFQHTISRLCQYYTSDLRRT